jgi:hypothetical protein
MLKHASEKTTAAMFPAGQDIPLQGITGLNVLHGGQPAMCSVRYSGGLQA